MKLDPLQVFLAILRYVFAIGVVVLAIIFIFSFKTVIITDQLERTNVETAENIFSSTLTYDRAVFDPDKLTAMISQANSIFHPDGKNLEDQPNIEPVARNCMAGYKAEIQDLKTGKTWGFGYVPYDAKDVKELQGSTMTYDTSIYIKGKERGYGDADPAKLTLTLRETWLSIIGCMIEEAYKFKQPQTIDVPCIFESRSGLVPGGSIPAGTSVCLLQIQKPDPNAKHLCIYKPPLDLTGIEGAPLSQPGDITIAECRYFPDDITISNAAWVYQKSQGNKKLTVYPLKTIPAGDSQSACSALEKDPANIAKDNDSVQAVILCVQ